MEKIKKLVVTILTMALLSSTTAMVFANSSEDVVDNATTCSSDNDVCSAEEVDLSQGEYDFVVEDGNVYIVPSQDERMGGGVGRCKVKNKTFSYEITKDAAEASLKAIKQGQAFTNVVAILLSTQVGKVGGVVVGFTALKLTSPGAYERVLNKFLNSGKQKGKLIFETHCVNRGYIQGEPMYDYVVDKAYVE